MADGPQNIRFSRKPYTVTYQDLKGEIKTVTRRPPPKVHDMMPTDIVSIKQDRSEHFQADEAYTVKDIKQKTPNTLQLTDEDGHTTFVDHHNVNLVEEVYPRERLESYKNSRYLLWP